MRLSSLETLEMRAEEAAVGVGEEAPMPAMTMAFMHLVLLTDISFENTSHLEIYACG